MSETNVIMGDCLECGNKNIEVIRGYCRFSCEFVALRTEVTALKAERDELAASTWRNAWRQATQELQPFHAHAWCDDMECICPIGELQEKWIKRARLKSQSAQKREAD